MLYIRLKGRLGNQLFIYSFARALYQKYGYKVLIYDRKDEKDAMWHSHLKNYALNKNIKFTSNKKDIMNMSPISKGLFVYDRLRIRHLSPRDRYNFQIKNLEKFRKHRLFLLMDGYVPLPSRIKDKTFFDGYFQSPRYFNSIRNEIITELTPSYNYTDEDKKFIEKIKNTESVCVTIRLGDYINNSTHQVCSKSFYINAMKKMMKLYTKCTFFIFSDEIDRARKIFDFDFPVIYDSGKMKDYASLHVMSMCKHFIISNSSFSWWAQYLSTNPNKKVIAPDKWYAKDVPCDIFEDNWILMKGKNEAR